MKYISRHRKPYSWSKSHCNWSMMVGCASWISVTVEETCNHVLLVVRFPPFPRGLGWPVLSESSGIFSSPTICVPKAAIKFQIWGTSFEGAGKHADDPACDIKLPWKNSLMSDSCVMTADQVKKFNDCTVFYCSWSVFTLISTYKRTSRFKDSKSAWKWRESEWPHLRHAGISTHPHTFTSEQTVDTFFASPPQNHICTQPQSLLL